MIMKKALLTLAIGCLAFVLKAQDRATTQDEYNYLRAGNYAVELPGHTLRSSTINLDIKFTFTGDRYVQISELYRDGSAAPCAIVLNIRADGDQYHIVVPDYNSDPAIWQEYKFALIGLVEKLNGNLLIATSFALGKYAASH